jgi:hypothetical protein
MDLMGPQCSPRAWPPVPPTLEALGGSMSGLPGSSSSNLFLTIYPILAPLANSSIYHSPKTMWWHQTGFTMSLSFLRLIKQFGKTHQVHVRNCGGIAKEVCDLIAIVPPFDSCTCCRGFDHAVVIVHTHSDDSTGDLWFCSHSTKSGGPAATEIGHVCTSLPSAQSP